MKKLSLLAGLCLVLLQLSCDRNTPDPVDPVNKPGTSTGAVTPVGTPQSTAVSATIGPAGGTLVSSDQRLRVVIPAGALSTTQKIEVQPITNKAPGGKGNAFRITPHGQQFAKPVTITYTYTERDLEGTFADALGIAYQTEKGTWKLSGKVTRDAAAKTVSVQTTHFSDWSFFTAITLEPPYKVLDPGKNMQLAVRSVLPDELLLVPLGEEAQELELINPEHLLDSKYIQKWELKGEGDLQATGSTGKYFAPSRIPAQNPVRVEVSIKSNGKAVGLLISRIYVAPEGISFQIDGQDWITYTGGANLNNGTNVLLARRSERETCQLLWKGKTEGQFNWSLTEVTMTMIQGQKIYGHLYGMGPDISGGTLTVDDDGNETGGYVIGTFHLEPAGWYQPDPYNPMGTARVRGFFRLKRVN